MLAIAPWLMDLLRGGRFHGADAIETTHLFRIFSFSLALWAVQGIYARAFYAASDTKTPAIAGTIIVLLSFPIYGLFYHRFGMSGLAFASDLGILAQTAVLSLLLHKKRLVSLTHLEFAELARALVAAIVAFFATWYVTRWLPAVSTHRADIITLTAGSPCGES